MFCLFRGSDLLNQKPGTRNQKLEAMNQKPNEGALFDGITVQMLSHNRFETVAPRRRHMAIEIDKLSEEDWESVRRIYLEGIATGNATFETEAPDWDSWDSTHLKTPRLVARRLNVVIGWAALSPVSRRQVYAGVAEVSVYVGGNAQGIGVGRELLMALIE